MTKQGLNKNVKLSRIRKKQTFTHGFWFLGHSHLKIWDNIEANGEIEQVIFRFVTIKREGAKPRGVISEPSI